MAGRASQHVAPKVVLAEFFNEIRGRRSFRGQRLNRQAWSAPAIRLAAGLTLGASLWQTAQSGSHRHGQVRVPSDATLPGVSGEVHQPAVEGRGKHCPSIIVMIHGDDLAVRATGRGIDV